MFSKHVGILESKEAEVLAILEGVLFNEIKALSSLVQVEFKHVGMVV